MKNVCNNKLCGKEFEDRITVNGMQMYCPPCGRQFDLGLVWGAVLALFFCFLVLIFVLVSVKKICL